MVRLSLKLFVRLMMLMKLSKVKKLLEKLSIKLFGEACDVQAAW